MWVKVRARARGPNVADTQSPRTGATEPVPGLAPGATIKRPSQGSPDGPSIAHKRGALPRKPGTATYFSFAFPGPPHSTFTVTLA